MNNKIKGFAFQSERIQQTNDCVLGERRTTLISAVIGKIDIRDWQETQLLNNGRRMYK